MSVSYSKSQLAFLVIVKQDRTQDNQIEIDASLAYQPKKLGCATIHNISTLWFPKSSK